MMIPLRGLPPFVFDMPWLLPMVLLMPLLMWWWRRVGAKKREQRLARLGTRSVLERLLFLDRAESLRQTLRLVVIAGLIGFALAGPRWGLSGGPVTASGIDMAIAVDVSLSMLAQDERPSRLERAKQEIRRLRALSPADRVALIAFAGRSYILSPLTSDDGAIELFLDNLDPAIASQGGSSLSRALRQGTELLMASDGSADRALVLMSDGEAFDPESDIESAAREAGRQGISVVTVGFGTEQGTTIPVRDGSSVYEKLDDQGRVVTTKYSPKLLEMVANAAHGTFVESQLSDKASRIRSALSALRTARRSVNARSEHAPRFLWVLVPALLLLFWDSWRLVRRSGPKISRPAITSAFLVMTSCSQIPDPAALYKEGDIAGAMQGYKQQIAQGDTTQQTLYNLSTTLIAADSLEEASARIDSVVHSTTGELQFRARFNAGLASLLLGKDARRSDANNRLANARADYRALLAERPGYLDGKWNYELALRLNPPNSGGGGGSGNSDSRPQSEQQQGELDRKQAEALLNSAAREERDVQGRKLKQRRPPAGERDW